MNRIAHPFLSEYYDRVAESLLQPAFSLRQFESDPPEQIFIKEGSLPDPLRKLGAFDGWDVRKLLISNNHNIRAFYLILLKLCFQGQRSLQYLKRVLELIFDPDFQIGFPTNKHSDTKLFNSKQFKKLFVDILYHLDMQENPDVEDSIGKYPLIDIVIIYIMRSLLTNRGVDCDFASPIPNQVVLRELGDHFQIPSTRLDQGYSVLDSFFVFEGFPSYLLIACSPQQDGFITRRSTISKIYTLEEECCEKQSVAEGRDPADQLPCDSIINNYSFRRNPIVGQTPKVETNQEYYPSIFESQVVPLGENVNQASFSNKANHINRDSAVTPIDKVIFNPKLSRLNLKDQIRKSQVRVSMLRDAETRSRSKDKVNTENIFCRNSYFGGGSHTKDALVKSSISPNSYQPGGVSNFAVYSSSVGPTKFSDKESQFKPSMFSQQSSEVSELVCDLGPKPRLISDNSYYKDFTSSFLLEDLPEVTKSTIKSIKRNFMKERSNIRMM